MLRLSVCQKLPLAVGAYQLAGKQVWLRYGVIYGTELCQPVDFLNRVPYFR